MIFLFRFLIAQLKFDQFSSSLGHDRLGFQIGPNTQFGYLKKDSRNLQIILDKTKLGRPEPLVIENMGAQLAAADRQRARPNDSTDSGISSTSGIYYASAGVGSQPHQHHMLNGDVSAYGRGLGHRMAMAVIWPWPSCGHGHRMTVAMVMAVMWPSHGHLIL